MESFFIFAIKTKKHPARFAIPPISSAGMTLWTDGHFFSSFTGLATHCICEQADVLLGGDAVKTRYLDRSSPPRNDDVR
jgi:hypothetical protein